MTKEKDKVSSAKQMIMVKDIKVNSNSKDFKNSHPLSPYPFLSIN